MIITGGSSGIGKATAEMFAKNNYRVYELSRHGESSEGITHIDCDVKSGDNGVRHNRLADKQCRHGHQRCGGVYRTERG